MVEKCVPDHWYPVARQADRSVVLARKPFGSLFLINFKVGTIAHHDSKKGSYAVSTFAASSSPNSWSAISRILNFRILPLTSSVSGGIARRLGLSGFGIQSQTQGFAHLKDGGEAGVTARR